MTNMAKSRLAKVIFSNIHKISDACANSFGRYIMIAQFLLFIKFKFLYKNGVLEKIKTFLPQHLPGLQQLFSLTFYFIQKIVSPIPI